MWPPFYRLDENRTIRDMPTLAIAFAAFVAARTILSVWYSGALVSLLVLTRNKRPVYGTVFDSSTMKPLAQAIVVLVRSFNGGVTRSAVTDNNGRFRIFAPEGRYRLRVSRVGYSFPSARLGDRRRIGHFVDIYNGGTIDRFPQFPLIAVNIPMDPAIPGKPDLAARVHLAWHGIELGVKILCVLPTAVTAIASRSLWLVGLSMVEVAAVVLTAVWLPDVRRQWGLVTNRSTRRTVPYAKIQLVDARTGRLIDSALSDYRGRYNFFVPMYRAMFLRCARAGYLPWQSKPLRFYELGFGGRLDVFGPDIVLEPDPNASAALRGEEVSGQLDMGNVEKQYEEWKKKLHSGS
jgi:hypothetical protein